MSEVFLQMGVLMRVLPFPYVLSVCPVSLGVCSYAQIYATESVSGGSAISVNLRPQVAGSGFWGLMQAMNEAV